MNTTKLVQQVAGSRVLARIIAGAARSASVVGDVIEIGRRLAECKEHVGHGGWLPWLEREFGWKERTAQNFMQVHALASKSAKFADLNVDVSALYLIAAPSTPEEVRTEVIERPRLERLFHDSAAAMMAVMIMAAITVMPRKSVSCSRVIGN